MRSLREAYLALNRELVATKETHDDTAKNESRNGNSRVSSDCSRGEVHGEKRGPNTYWWRGRVGSFKDADQQFTASLSSSTKLEPGPRSLGGPTVRQQSI